MNKQEQITLIRRVLQVSLCDRVARRCQSNKHTLQTNPHTLLWELNQAKDYLAGMSQVLKHQFAACQAEYPFCRNEALFPVISKDNNLNPTRLPLIIKLHALTLESGFPYITLE